MGCHQELAAWAGGGLFSWKLPKAEKYLHGDDIREPGGGVNATMSSLVSERSLGVRG